MKLFPDLNRNFISSCDKWKWNSPSKLRKFSSKLSLLFALLNLPSYSFFSLTISCSSRTPCQIYELKCHPYMQRLSTTYITFPAKRNEIFFRRAFDTLEVIVQIQLYSQSDETMNRCRLWSELLSFFQMKSNPKLIVQFFQFQFEIVFKIKITGCLRCL